MAQMTLLSAVSFYLKSKRRAGLSPYTVESYRKTLAKFADHAGEDTPISQITQRTVDDFADSLIDAGLEKETQGHYLRELKVFLRWCGAERLMDDVPVVTMPRVRAKIKTKLISPDDFAKLVAAAEGKSVWNRRNVAILSLLYDSGCRIGELCNLRAEDVNIDAGQAFVTGKGDKQRVIFFGDRTAIALTRYRMRLELVNSPEWFFVTERLEQMTPNTVRLMLRRITKRTDVTCDTNPHNFRHSFATNFLRNGGDVMFLKRMLGHSTLAVTEIYTSLVTDDLAKAHSQFSPLARAKDRGSNGRRRT